MNTFLQGVPLLQRQLQTSSLDELMKAFQVQPFGTTQDQSGQSQTQGTSTMNGTNVQQGNPLGGLFGGLGAGLFAPQANGQSSLQSIIDMFKPKLGTSGDFGGEYQLRRRISWRRLEDQYYNPIIQAMIHTATLQKQGAQQEIEKQKNKEDAAARQQQLKQEEARIKNEHEYQLSHLDLLTQAQQLAAPENKI